MISIAINDVRKNICIEEDRIAVVGFLESNGALLTRPDVLIILFVSYCLDKNLIQANATLKNLLQKNSAEVRRAYNDIDLVNLIPVLNSHLPAASTGIGKAIWSLIDSFFSIFDDRHSVSLHYNSKGVVKNKLVEYGYSLKPRESVRIDCYMRRYWWDEVPTTREHDVGPRLITALGNGGWNPTLRFLERGREPDFFPTSGATIAIVDLQCNFFSKQSEKSQMFLELLRENYQITVGVFFDAWMDSAVGLKNDSREYFDWFWCPGAPSSSVSAGALDFPFPLGVNLKTLVELRRSVTVDTTAQFRGSIEHVNLSRFYWKSALSKIGVCDFNDHQHKNDGLSAQQSFIKYLEGIATGAACLNFSMRGNGERVITGRAFESIAIGKTLLQEFASNASNYFIPDEHFYEFNNIEELLSLLDRMNSDPCAFYKRASSGSSFWDARYADRMLVRHFAKIFFE
jgi:hypothetical protein